MDVNDATTCLFLRLGIACYLPIPLKDVVISSSTSRSANGSSTTSVFSWLSPVNNISGTCTDLNLRRRQLDASQRHWFSGMSPSGRLLETGATTTLVLRVAVYAASASLGRNVNALLSPQVSGVILRLTPLLNSSGFAGSSGIFSTVFGPFVTFLTAASRAEANSVLLQVGTGVSIVSLSPTSSPATISRGTVAEDSPAIYNGVLIASIVLGGILLAAIVVAGVLLLRPRQLVRVKPSSSVPVDGNGRGRHDSKGANNNFARARFDDSGTGALQSRRQQTEHQRALGASSQQPHAPPPKVTQHQLLQNRNRDHERAYQPSKQLKYLHHDGSSPAKLYEKPGYQVHLV